MLIDNLRLKQSHNGDYKRLLNGVDLKLITYACTILYLDNPSRSTVILMILSGNDFGKRGIWLASKYLSTKIINVINKNLSLC